MAKVYVNRTLNLKKIRYIGFDMDHTLVRYNSRNFEALAHKTMLKKLVEELGYPMAITEFPFEYERAQRGLVVDKNRGNVLKLSRFGGIRVSYHGLHPIDYSTQKRLYKSTYVDLRDPVYSIVDTTFSIAFAALFAQLVEMKDSKDGVPLPPYERMADDLIMVLDRAHRDGTLKGQVAKDLDKYIIPDKGVAEGLERFAKHGKKVFLLTNSDFFYTRLLLDHTITPYLKEHKHWSQVFEFVIISAQKPRFFVDDLKFLKIDPRDGRMENFEGPLTQGIYQGGSAKIFTDNLSVAPDEILYIGDHIYGDIVRLKKDCAWRTALVVEELENEIQQTRAAEKATEKINALMEKKLPLETEIDRLISERIEAGNEKNEPRVSQLLKTIAELDGQIAGQIKQQQKHFNPYWGEIMRVGIEESFFAYQVERFACIYMTKLSDFLTQSPRTYYRAAKRALAHEIEG